MELSAAVCLALLFGILSAFGLYGFYNDLIMPLFHFPAMRFGQFYFLNVFLGLITMKKGLKDNDEPEEILGLAIVMCAVIWLFYGAFVLFVR